MNRRLNGVYCDLAGTLFKIGTGEVDENILAILKEYSKTQNVTLWTGGDLDDAQKDLDSAKIDFPLVSKYRHEGDNAEIVIDDLPQSDFEKRYKICSREYIQVKPNDL